MTDTQFVPHVFRWNGEPTLTQCVCGRQEAEAIHIGRDGPEAERFLAPLVERCIRERDDE